MGNYLFLVLVLVEVLIVRSLYSNPKQTTLRSTSSLRHVHHYPSSSKITSTNTISSLFGDNDSERLKRARVRVAEVQGLVPQGVSQLPLDSIQNIKTNPSLSRIREVSWRVAEPETKYDPAAAATKLLTQPLRWLKRNIQIFVPITLFAIRIILDIITGREEKKRQKRADQLLNIISSQSPALIKAGQALSSRSDLLPKEYLESLQKLQDRCPPFPTEQAFALFKEETGYQFEDVFELESMEPVAAASIGQVYKGRLRSTGAKVAIKIQRPKCEESIAIDLFILRWYSQRMQQLLLLLGRKVDLVSVVDDFGDLLYREIDYRAEAVNAQRFAELYGTIPDIYVPKVYTQLSTQKILTLEWIDGARLTDLPALQRMGLEPTKLVNALVQCSLRQMLENGFFHADPHAGNLLAMSNGKLCYLDFGMVSYVEPAQRYAIIEAVVHMVNRDFVTLTELYRRMGFIPKDVDTKPIIQALEKALPDVLNAPVGDFNFKNVISKLGDVMYKFPFSLPPFYIAIIRCLGVLEGIAIQIDSNFRIISDAYPYVASRLLTDPSPELQAALQQLLFNDQGKLRWDRLEELLEKAMTIPDYDVAMAIDHAVKYLVLPQASTLRVQLAEELVNGFDQLESEAVDLLVQYAASGEITLASLRKVLDFRGDGRGLDTLLDRFLALQQQKEGSNTVQEASSSSLYSLARALRILRSSSPSSAPPNGNSIKTIAIPSNGKSAVASPNNSAYKTSNLTLLLRKLLREPVLQEWLIQIIGDISERVSMKMIRRVFGRSERGGSGTSAANPNSKNSNGVSPAEMARRKQRSEKRYQQALRASKNAATNGNTNRGGKDMSSAAVNLAAMAFFSGLDLIMKQGPTTATMSLLQERFQLAEPAISALLESESSNSFLEQNNGPLVDDNEQYDQEEDTETQLEDKESHSDEQQQEKEKESSSKVDTSAVRQMELEELPLPAQEENILGVDSFEISDNLLLENTKLVHFHTPTVSIEEFAPVEKEVGIVISEGGFWSDITEV